MVKPYVFVACEKVLFSAEQVASLINLFSAITIHVPADSEIPHNAVAPKEWAIFTAWDVEPGDETKDYSICTLVLYPDQSQFGEVTRNRMDIQPNKPRAQFNVQIPAFPMGQTGKYTVRTWIEENQQIVFAPIELKVELIINRQVATVNAPTASPTPAPSM